MHQVLEVDHRQNLPRVLRQPGRRPGQQDGDDEADRQQFHLPPSLVGPIPVRYHIVMKQVRIAELRARLSE